MKRACPGKGRPGAGILRASWLAVVLATAMPPGARAQPAACIPVRDVATRGVHLGDSEARVRQRLGPPRQVAAGSAEDDGGTYALRTLRYRNLEVTLGRDRVESIVIVGAGQPIVPGLIVGGSAASPLAVTTAAPHSLAPGSAFGLALCEEDDIAPIAGLSLFVEAGRIARAELFGYGP